MSHAKALIRLSLVFLIIQSAFCEWKPNIPKKDRPKVCKTPECTERGKQYKKNMNTDRSPCNDFYTFACGNFRTNHPGPKYAAEWKVLDVMNAEFAGIIQRTLESYNVPANTRNELSQAKDVYETCMKIPEYPLKDAKDITREIMKIGRFPDTSLWEIHSKYLKLSGESAFFRSKILANRPSEGTPVLMLMEPSSVYGSIKHESAWKTEEKEAYAEFLFLAIKSLKLTGSDTLIKERIQKVFEFRRQLDLVIKQFSGWKPNAFTPLSLRELDMWFLENVPGMTKTQDIPWKDIIDVLLQHLPETMRYNRKLIAIRQSKYFLDLMELLKNTPEEVLAHHVEMYFIEGHLKLNSKMYQLLEETSVEPHKLFTYIREGYYPRWQTCIRNHNMKETLEKMLFEKWFPKEYIGIVHQIITNLKGSIEQQMLSSPWLNQATRKATMLKLNKLEEWIGFPVWFTEFAFPKPRNTRDILTPNAWLDKRDNVITVQPPLFLPPVFSPTIPSLYNYAGIGNTLGHELYHTLDECGSYLDGDTNQIWWPEEMRIECIKKKFLFVEEFNKIANREFLTRYGMDLKSDTSTSFSENFPDVMGIKAAYYAYKELEKTDKSVCRTLPNFEKYSCDQMFFISLANGYCGYYTSKLAKEKLESSVHSIDSVRVNGMVANMPNFGPTFGCDVGDPMHPEKKLDLWH